MRAPRPRSSTIRGESADSPASTSSSESRSTAGGGRSGGVPGVGAVGSAFGEPPEPGAFSGELWLPNGYGNPGFLMFPALHKDFAVTLKGRHVEILLVLAKVRARDLRNGRARDAVGWVGYRNLAKLVAENITARGACVASPTSPDAARRYVGAIEKELEAMAKLLGMPWKRAWFIERKRRIGVRLLVDVEIRL